MFRLIEAYRLRLGTREAQVQVRKFSSASTNHTDTFQKVFQVHLISIP